MCRISAINFEIFGKSGSYNLAQPMLLESLELKKRIELVLKVELPKDTLRISSVVCRPCAQKFERILKLNDTYLGKLKFECNSLSYQATEGSAVK